MTKLYALMKVHRPDTNELIQRGGVFDANADDAAALKGLKAARDATKAEITTAKAAADKANGVTSAGPDEQKTEAVKEEGGDKKPDSGAAKDPQSAPKGRPV